MEFHEIICFVFRLVLVFAAYLMVRDIIRIVSQLRAFHDITAGMEIASGDTRSPHEIARHVNAKLDGIEQKEENHYVMRRLRFAIEMVLHNDSGHTQQLPSVDEWHAREVEEENSRRSVSISRTLVASLLIMGIVGTLVCLHHGDCFNKISRGEVGVLRDALQPSLWAIGGTVILLMLLGLYRLAFERLESRVNRYTMEVLLPCFQLTTNTEQLEEDMSQSVDVLNVCIEHIAHNFRQHVYPFMDEVRHYRQSIGKLFSALGTSCESISEAVEDMDENTVRESGQLRQMRATCPRVLLPSLQKMDGLLTAIPEKLQDLLSLMQKHLDRFTILSSELSSLPRNVPGQLAPEVKMVFSKLRQQYHRVQAKLYAIRTHDQKSLLGKIQGEVEAQKRTEAALSSAESPMKFAIQNIDDLAECLQKVRIAYAETTVAQVRCMEMCKKKLSDLRMQLDAREKQMEHICAALHRRYLAYRKRPWLFLNWWDLIVSSLLLALLFS